MPYILGVLGKNNQQLNEKVGKGQMIHIKGKRNSSKT